MTLSSSAFLVTGLRLVSYNFKNNNPVKKDLKNMTEQSPPSPADEYEKEDPDRQGPPPPKRPRAAGSDVQMLVKMAEENDTATSLRSSSLSSATMKLSGHTGSVYAVQYSPQTGATLCSASFDSTCLLWNHHSKDYDNFNVLEGHQNAVLDCQWCDDETVVTCSADHTVQLWDAQTGQRLRKWGRSRRGQQGQSSQSEGHSAIVNALAVPDPDSQTIASVSDDGTALLWDRRQKRPAARLIYSTSSPHRNNKNNTDHLTRTGSLSSSSMVLPLTAVAYARNQQIFTGSIDNLIVCWDVKMQRKLYALQGHADTITSLSLHPEQTHLLSNSMDHSLRTWDIRPFTTNPHHRHEKTFLGHVHNAEKGLLKCAWSPTGTMVTAGSADHLVHIWDEFSTEELYVLPGHAGAVNAVSFHPIENVIVSGASDKQIYVGELS